MVWLPFKAFSVAIDTLLEIADCFLRFGLLKALIADGEIGGACLIVVLLHH
jgi:hypothetical protein